MEQNNLEQLKKLAKVFNTDNVITSAEIEQVLTGIVSIMASFRQENIKLTDENRKMVSELMSQVENEYKKTIDNIDNKSSQISKSFNKTVKDLKNKFDTEIKTVRALIDEVLAIEVKDGKDADEEKIVQDVLAQIKLPENKVLTAEEIKTELETLEGDKRLDISAIKGAEKLSTQANLDRAISILDQRTQFLINKRSGGSASAFTDLTDAPNSYSGQSLKYVRVNAGETGLEFSTVSGSGTPGGSNTQLQYNNAGSFGGISGATTNGTAVTYSSGNLLVTDVKASGSAGVSILNSSGGTVADFGTGGSTNSSIHGAININTDSTDYIQLTGGTGNVTKTAVGGSANIDITVVPKGTGKFKVTGDANISGLTASKVVFTDSSKDLTSTGIGNSTDFIKGDGSLDNQTYLTGNQTIALSGDVSGTGSTAITTTISAGAVDIAMLSATGTPSATTFLRGDNTWATPAGSGTVTNTGGNLTANSVVLGAGTADVKVVAGITTDGAGQLILGVNATTLGNVKMFGSTSGDVTFGPAAVAGTATVFTLPATNGTNGYFLQTNGSGVTSWAAATGGLTNWTEAYGAGTQATSSFTATNAAANVNAALVAKGTGATVAQIPDGGTGGGNSRGQYATDWQKVRNTNDMVASGNYSTIGGGERNKVVGSWATVAGGYNNRAASSSSTVAGGESNNISAGSAAVISGGSSNSSTQDYIFIGGGISNSITGAYGVIAGGNTNTVSATNALVSGGSTNTASGQNSGVTNGLYAEAHLYGERTFAAGRFAAAGDAQGADLLWRNSITGTSATELFLDGSSVQAILKSGNTVWNAKIQVVATTSSIGNGSGAVGNSFSGEYLVSIKRLGTTTSLVGTVQTIATTADTNMTASVVTITADDTTEALKITFTPDGATAGTTTVTRVVARGTIAEVRY